MLLQNCNELFGNWFFQSPRKIKRKKARLAYRNEDGKAIIGKILVFVFQNQNECIVLTRCEPTIGKIHLWYSNP